MSDVLKPCPFCPDGGKAYYTESVNGSRMAYCGCSKCGVELKAMVTYGPLENGEKKLTKDIIGIWNTRQAPPSADAEKSKVLEALDKIDDEIVWLLQMAKKMDADKEGKISKPDAGHLIFNSITKINEWLHAPHNYFDALSRIGGGEWRTIDSAPRDGKKILVNDRGHITTMFWERDLSGNGAKKTRQGWTDGTYNRREESQEYFPTHWQPLPQPPKINAPGKDGEG